MTAISREIYASPNGDVWSLVRIDGRTIVRHQANIPSGGNITDAEVADFLKAGGLGPEKQALQELIGTLVDDVDIDQVASSLLQQRADTSES